MITDAGDSLEQERKSVATASSDNYRKARAVPEMREASVERIEGCGDWSVRTTMQQPQKAAPVNKRKHWQTQMYLFVTVVSPQAPLFLSRYGCYLHKIICTLLLLTCLIYLLPF